MRISIDYDFQPSRTWFACLSDFKLFLSHRFSGLPLPPLFFLKYSASSLVLWQGSDCPRMDSVCVCAVGRVKLAVFFFFYYYYYGRKWTKHHQVWIMRWRWITLIDLQWCWIWASDGLWVSVVDRAIRVGVSYKRPLRMTLDDQNSRTVCHDWCQMRLKLDWNTSIEFLLFIQRKNNNHWFDLNLLRLDRPMRWWVGVAM